MGTLALVQRQLDKTAEEVGLGHRLQHSGMQRDTRESEVCYLVAILSLVAIFVVIPPIWTSILLKM